MLVNDICLTRCQVNNAAKKGNYIVLNCTTQIPSESGSLVNCAISAYISEEIYRNPRLKQLGLKPGAFLKLTGKTVINVENTNIHMDMLIETVRRIEYPAKQSEAIIKLFDVKTSTSARSVNELSDHVEFTVQYKNSENAKGRLIVMGLGYNEPKVELGHRYNVSGTLFFRYDNGSFVPVIRTDTVVKDIVLDERVPVKM